MFRMLTNVCLYLFSVTLQRAVKNNNYLKGGRVCVLPAQRIETARQVFAGLIGWDDYGNDTRHLTNKPAKILIIVSALKYFSR